jgi:plastocyanin
MSEFARRCGGGLAHCALLTSAMFVLAATNANAANWNVDVGGAQLAFSPATLTISAGDTVTFVNQGGFHNVAADDGAFRCAKSCSGSGGDPDSVSWSSTVTLASPGTVGYHCEVHGAPGQGMFGTITVQPAPPVLPPPQSAIDNVPNGGAGLYLLLGAALIAGAGLSWSRRSRSAR